MRVGARSEPPSTGTSEDAALPECEGPAWKLLFERHPQPMLVYDPETLALLAVNDAALRLYGHPREALLAMTLMDLRPADEIPDLLARIPEPTTGLRAALAVHHRTKDGADLELEMSTEEVRFGQGIARLALLTDVTKWRRIEQARRESERRLREVLESAPLVAVTLDREGRVTFCNQSLLRLSGYAEEEVLGKGWYDLFASAAQDRRSAFVSRMEEGLVLPHEEHAIVARGGELRLVAWTSTVLRDESGTIIGAASIGTDVTEQRRVEAKLAHDALHDALTGLPNRALFLERLAGAMLRARRREGYVYAVLLVDLDRFKIINESLGHVLGDRLLVEAGKVLRACVRPEDTVARLGGDEFTILLDDAGDALHATRIASRIHEALSAPFHIGGHEVFTTASIGIALSTTAYDSPEEVLRDADTAMYRAKARGKARHEIFDTSMHRRAVALHSLETDLRRALDRKELQVAFQPIVSLKSGAITGFEALARWSHPRRGQVSPMEFIPIAEETGLIQSIGRWVLHEACREMRRWLDDNPGPGGFSMSVNLSTKQFQAGLVEEVDRALRESGLEPRSLKLEITESVLMENADSAADMLAEIRNRGVHLCIDDFGTGYSSLSYLLRFPIDTLKIDRSFVKGMGDDGELGSENLELVRTIVTLARNLGLDVVAEGVETAGQRIRLEALGCQHAQGFLFSPPVDAAAASKLIATQLAARKRASEAPRG